MSASVSYSFSPTTTIESSQVNQNFTDLVNYLNNTACVAGMVVGWKGAVVDIPAGWTLDDDLKDKFVVGAGNSYAVGATGGSNTKDLSHTHTGPSHTHAGTTDAGGGVLEGDSTNEEAFAAPNHTHTFTTGASGTGNTGSGGSATQDIRPPYYALCYIRKT